MSTVKQIIKRLTTAKFDKKINLHTKNILGITTISLLDVGAANGTYDRWSAFTKFVDYFAVEPDARSSSTVLKTEPSGGYNSQSLINKALWHTRGEVVLNLCRKPMASSVYEPNREFIDLFPEPERNEVVERIKLSCDTVDNIANETNSNFDVMKLDVQGAELDVLRGSTKVLANTLAIDIEVEFSEIYKNQPLFDSIFGFLRSHEFEFIDFTYVYRWSPDSYNGIGQATFSDALFMRSPEKIGASSDLTLLRKYAVICAIFERGDLLMRLSNYCTKHSKLEAKIIKEIADLGLLLSARNARTQRLLNRAMKVIRLFHPRVRAHVMH